MTHSVLTKDQPKPKRRRWVALILLVLFGVSGYAIWRASETRFQQRRAKIVEAMERLENTYDAMPDDTTTVMEGSMKVTRGERDRLETVLFALQTHVASGQLEEAETLIYMQNQRLSLPETNSQPK